MCAEEKEGAMRYTPCWKQIGIAKDRYLELLHFCRQYPEWKLEASSLIGIRAMRADGQPRTEKIAIVEECARAIDGGAWFAAIIQNVCMAKPYTTIDRTLMPTSDKNAYFKRRREFFELLDRKTEK